MPPTHLFDISEIDLDRVLYGVEDIERINPHRGEMRMIDAISYASEDEVHWAAYKDVRDDEFWVPGHIPGQPVFPGVLMVEAVAQLASYRCLRAMPECQFMGFAGIDGVKFRGQILPGDRLYMLLKQIEFRPRRCICDAQGYANDTLVFEGRITGMPMKVRQTQPEER